MLTNALGHWLIIHLKKVFIGKWKKKVSSSKKLGINVLELQYVYVGKPLSKRLV